MYKGFDNKLCCREFQYEIGKEYETDKAELCNSGFHACENPIDVFDYYAPADSRYCEVELEDVSEEKSNDSKRVGKRIRIGAEIGIKGVIDAFVKFTFDRIDWKNKKESNTGDQSAATNTGNRSAATNTGDQSAATNTGYQSAATNTGDWSAAEVSGKSSVAIATGFEGKVRGAIGCAIVAVERNDDGDLLSIASGIVEGTSLKPDVWYMVIDGAFVEVEQ